MEKHDKSLLLYAAPFPIYGLATTSRKGFVVSGGGGHSRYGVENLLQYVEQVADDELAQVLCGHKSTEHAINKIDISENGSHVAGCQEDSLCLFALTKLEKDAPNLPAARSQSAQKRQKHKDRRKESSKKQQQEASHGGQRVDGGSGFGKLHWKEVKVVVTDNDKKDPHQTCAAFSHSGLHVATGGEGGLVKVFSVPNLSLIFEKQLDKRIEDIRYSTTGSRLAVASGKHVLILNASSGALIKTLASEGTMAQKLCAFVRSPSSPTEKLITVGVKAMGKPSQIVQWDCTTWKPLAAPVELARAPIGCLAVSADGKYLAMGDTNGGVLVCLSSTLAVVVKSKPHKLFVTNVAFLPHRCDGKKGAAKERCDGKNAKAPEAGMACVVSSSADQTLMLTHVPSRQGLPLAMLLLIGVVILLFIALSLLSSPLSPFR